MGKPARGGPAGARRVIPSRASGGPQSLFPPGHELFLMRPEQDNLQKNCQSKHSRQGETPATETRAGMLLEDALHASEADQMDVTCSRAETRPQKGQASHLRRPPGSPFTGTQRARGQAWGRHTSRATWTSRRVHPRSQLPERATMPLTLETPVHMQTLTPSHLHWVQAQHASHC